MTWECEDKNDMRVNKMSTCIVRSNENLGLVGVEKNSVKFEFPAVAHE
jgi:hypothetical protein